MSSFAVKGGQGLLLTNTFYWDRNEASRAFTQRVLAAGFPEGMRPNMSQAACYAGTRHFLQAVAAMGVADAKRSGAAIASRMKQMPIEDGIYEGASIRADGRVVSPAFLYEVKAPQESHGAWDYNKLVATVPVEQAWRPLSQSGCSLAPA